MVTEFDNEEISAFFEEKTAEWHQIPDGRFTLQEYLGMNDEEYAVWVKDDTVTQRVLGLWADDIMVWRDQQAGTSHAYSIWVTQGDYGDPQDLVVALALDAAKQWCNEHRKLGGADPITWEKETSEETHGYARRFKTPFGSSIVFYGIERKPLI